MTWPALCHVLPVPTPTSPVLTGGLHRYYGKSQPNAANASDFTHLTIEQVLQNFAVLIAIRPTPRTAVVAAVLYSGTCEPIFPT